MFRNAGFGILQVELGDDVIAVLLVQRPFRSNTSTIAAISHMLETVASLIDMLSRVGRLLDMVE